MSEHFYALRSKEGTAVIDIDDGCVQVFETWEQAVKSSKRSTDEIVAVSIKRIGGENEGGEIESLRTQLAKANEREKRLEKILQRYESEQLQPLKLRVKELEKNSKDRFIKFAKSNNAVDGKSALFIHALGVAFDKEQLRKEQEK